MLLARTERGLSMRDPDPGALGRLVANLQRGDSYLVLERFGAGEPAGDWYVQVLLRDNGVFQVEYRDGVPSSHRRTLTVSAAKVVNALVGWSTGRAGWREPFDWIDVGHEFADVPAGPEQAGPEPKGPEPKGPVGG